jgi:hypothetical protein
MGRGLLLIVLASSITISKMNASEKETEIETQIVLTEYQEKVLSRELAHSALNVVVANVTRDFTAYREQVSDRAYGDGMYAYTAEGNASGPVTVVSYGQVGDVIHQITAILEKSGTPVFDAITLDGPFASVTGSGTSFSISGIDGPLVGEDESGFLGADGHAIRTTLPAARDMFLANMDADQLQGVDGPGDVVAGESHTDLDAFQDSILAHPSLITLQGDQRFNGNDDFGSRESPVIMAVNGDVKITGSVEGYGILLINGSLVTPGSLTWEGVIMVVSDGGSTDLRGNVDIRGALVMRSQTAAGESGGYTDAGLLGGHIDVSVLRALNTKIYHEHQYDDKWDVSTLDLLSPGCQIDGGLCWEANVGASGASTVRLAMSGTSSVGGQLYLENGSTLVETDIVEGLDLEVDPAELTAFQFRFTSVCNVKGSNPETVDLDQLSRDGMLRLKVTNPANADSLLHEVVVYRHSTAEICSGSEDPGLVDVAPQTFYINGDVNIQRSAEALSNVSSLMPMIEPQPAEIRMTSMRHRSNDVAL